MALSKKPVTGMKDILPEEMEIRDYVISVIKDTYGKFGFTSIETPCVENLANLNCKAGGENEKLIFKILKRGEKLKIDQAKEEIDLDVAHIDSEYKIGYELTKELLKETTDVTAIVGLNDMIAFGIMDALHEAKIKVPTDVSVMGCDNTLFARMHNMNLTTIEHFVTFKGRDACDIIMKKIATHHSTNTGAVPISTYHVEYEPQLIVRGTTTYAKNARKKKN